MELAAYNEPIDSNIVTFFDNPKFPYHMAGLSSSHFYRLKGQKYSFRAGSRPSYNQWRDWLAQVSGFKDAHDIWRLQPLTGFVELINFSDSDGTIGPVVSSKLAKDFKDFEKIAIEKSKNTPFMMDMYYNWKKAFEVAAKNGAIKFY